MTPVPSLPVSYGSVPCDATSPAARGIAGAEYNPGYVQDRCIGGGAGPVPVGEARETVGATVWPDPPWRVGYSSVLY